VVGLLFIRNKNTTSTGLQIGARSSVNLYYIKYSVETGFSPDAPFSSQELIVPVDWGGGNRALFSEASGFKCNRGVPDILINIY